MAPGATVAFGKTVAFGAAAVGIPAAALGITAAALGAACVASFGAATSADGLLLVASGLEWDAEESPASSPLQAFTAAVSCSGFTTGLAEVLLSSAATHAVTVGARVGVGTGRSVKEGAFFGAKKAITSLFVAGRNCNCSESPSGADLGMAVGGADLGMAVGGFARAGVTAVDAAALATAKLPWSGVAAVVADKLP